MAIFEDLRNKAKVRCTPALLGMVACRPEVVGSAHNSIQSRSMSFGVELTGSASRYWVG